MSKRRSSPTKAPQGSPGRRQSVAIPRHQCAERWLAAVCGAILFLVFFQAVLFQPRFFYIRDISTFFNPLYRFVHQQWSESRIPLWNPYSNGGTPLLAQGTPAVLYPLQLVFRLPLAYEVNLKLYVLIHVALTLAFTYALARRLRTSPAAAALAAIAYAFGGVILFNFSNPPFLCSGTWMPAAFYATLQMLERRSLGWALALAAIAALILLGGDPQGAYHALILAGLAALFRWQIQRRRLRQSWNEQLTWDLFRRWAAERWRQRRVLLLVAAGAMGLLLSAPQLLPTLELSARSTRAAQRLPHSLYQIPGFFWRGEPLPPQTEAGQPVHWYDTLRGTVVPGERNHFIRYLYSVPPPRLIEFIWPNVSGGRDERTRWLIAIGGEPKDAQWFPSCYLGLAPLVLAIAVWNPCCRRPWTAWLSAIALIGVLASFGSYGLVGLFRCIATGRLQHWPDSVGGEVGGMYWLLATGLPAYDGFRYPAKLLALAALALSLLAAIACRRVARHRRTQTMVLYLLLVTGGLSLAAAVGVWCFPGWITGPLRERALLSGQELDVEAVLRLLRFSFCQTLAIAAILAALIANLRGNQSVAGWRQTLRGWTPTILLAVTAADVSIANSYLVVTAPFSVWSQPPALAGAIAAADAEQAVQNNPAPFPRTFLTLWMKGEERDLGRSYFAADQRLGLFMPNTETFGLEEFEPFLNPWPQDGVGYIQPRCGLDAWGVQYFGWAKTFDSENPHSSALGLTRAWHEPRLVPDKPQLAPQGPPLPSLPHTDVPELANVTIVANPSALPRARIVHQIEPVATFNAADQTRHNLMMVMVNYPLPGWRDLRTLAVVEDDALVQQFGSGVVPLGDGNATAAEPCEFLEYAADKVRLQAELRSPGLLVLSETHYPGWELTVSSGGGPPVAQPILRVNGCMRGVLLPAGRHELTFRFRPASFWRGAAIGGCAWLGLLGFAVVSLIARRRQMSLSRSV